MSKRCTQCGGSGEQICEGCGGRGLLEASNDEDSYCRSCDGLGTIDCPACNGMGTFTYAQREEVPYYTY